ELHINLESAGYLHQNQRVVNRVDASELDQSYYVLQIADYDVDSIIPFQLKQNRPCNQGERFSQIRFGSQVDLIVPLSDRFYLVPTPRNCGLQDLVFTANLGVVLEHVPQRDVVVISNFTSKPRWGETEIGVDFFKAMGYRVYVAPSRFEGDAELKHLQDNVYVGGYGTRSERDTYEWMEKTFGMKVIKVRLSDPYLYHLDCSVFPITRENTLVCTEL